MVNVLDTGPVFKKKVFVGVELLYNVALVSAVEQNETAICIHTYIWASQVALVVKNRLLMQVRYET